MVRNDDGWLAGQAQPPQFRYAHNHFGCLPGPDIVSEQHRRLVDHPGDRGELVGARPEVGRQAGQRQRRAVVAAQDQAVEPLVVGGGQVGGAGRVFPGPVAEPVGQLGGLFLGGEGGVEVEDGAVTVRGADEVADLDLALFEDGLGELRRGVSLGAPGGGGQHAGVLPRTAQTWPPGCSTRSRGSSRISRRNCSHVAGVDPGCAEPGVDLAGGQVRAG